MAKYKINNGLSFLKRSLTVIITTPVIAVCTYFGGIPFLVLVLFLAFISINEFYFLMKKKGFDPAYWVGNFFTLFFIFFAYFALKRNWEPAHSAILTVSVMITMVASLFLKRPKNVIVDIAVTILGMIYIGWLFSYLLFIRALTEHGAYLFFLMITVWAEDIVAYLVGTKFGRTKLMPRISPKKSVEGAIAGFLVCIAAALIFSQFIGMNIVDAIILGVLIGVMAPISDLVESVVKRDVGVKDTGDIIPGHGGVLDRMDSFILTAPVMYYYITWVVLR